MTKAYNRINWQNEPSTDTALNEQNLNKMDRAIDVIDDRVCGMEESVQAKVDEAGEKVTDAEAQVKLAQSYAKGGTGSRQGENTDNAMYYRNQAREYAENAEAVVGIGIATPEQAGIVKPDGTSITVDLDGTIHVSAISEQSNPNLLDNPFFTVNQRGQRSYSGVGYTVDRWRGRTGTSVLKINADTSITTEGSWAIVQILEPSLIEQISDKTVTISALLADGSIVSKSGTAISTAINNNNVWLTVEGRLQVQGNIKAVKLEVGAVSTLANDIAPNYAEELLKCMMSTADSADTYANKRIATRYDDQNTFSEVGVPHYEEWRAKLQFNVDGDSAFKWICGSRQFPTKVDLANEFFVERKSGVSLNSLFINSRNTFKVYVVDADCSNAPSGFIGGWLEACTIGTTESTTLVEQTLHNYDGRVWTRRYYLGVWTDWLSVSANVITTSAPTEGAVSAYPIGTTIDVIE